MPGVDLHQLQSFLAVAEHQSFTLAARALSLSQAGVSRQIQRLERELGAPLFIRGRDGVKLTEAGERYRAFAEELLSRHTQLLEEIRGTGAIRGELRIAASTTPAEFLVARLIADFTALHPQVQAIVFTADSRRVVEEVWEGARDIGFVGARFERKGLHFDPIAEDEIVLAVPAHHPFAARGEIPLEALEGQRLIEREDGSGTMASVRRALAARGLSLPPYHTVMTLTTTQAIVSAVRAGYGLGFISSLAIGDGAPGGPVPVRLAGVPLRRMLYLVRDKRRQPPPAGRRFVEFVLERFAARTGYRARGSGWQSATSV